MTDKLLVEIMLPAAEKTYDVFIPPDSKIKDIIKLLIKMFSELAKDYYAPVQTTLLCDANGSILDMNSSPVELGIKNGSRLMLI